MSSKNTQSARRRAKGREYTYMLMCCVFCLLRRWTLLIRWNILFGTQIFVVDVVFLIFFSSSCVYSRVSDDTPSQFLWCLLCIILSLANLTKLFKMCRCMFTDSYVHTHAIHFFLLFLCLLLPLYMDVFHKNLYFFRNRFFFA